MTVSRSVSFTAGLTFAFVSFAAIVWGEPQPSEVPDDSLTPGIVASTDESEVCGTVGGLTYSKRHRLDHTIQRSIRERDGCDPHNSEVDHRCALALGCADVEQNLWCQPGPAQGVTWNYHDKDRLEVYAWQSVCHHHTMTLDEAQKMFIAPSNWIERYCEVFDDTRCK